MDASRGQSIRAHRPGHARAAVNPARGRPRPRGSYTANPRASRPTPHRVDRAACRERDAAGPPKASAFEPRARHHGYQDDRAPAAGDRHARVHGVRARRPRRPRRLDGRQGELSAPHGERATPRRPPRRDSKNSKHALTTETRPSCPSPRLPRPSPDSRSCQTPDSRLTRARLRPDLRPDRRTMSPSGAR